MNHKSRSIHAEAGLHRKLVLFAAQLEGYLQHFPNCHKYALTQAIRVAFIDVFNLVTEAQKRYHKKTTLTQLDVRHEQLRMLLHLANELGLFDFSKGRADSEQPGERRFLVILRLVDEIGRMIGGWVNTELRPPADAPDAGQAVGDPPAAKESSGYQAAGAVVA